MSTIEQLFRHLVGTVIKDYNARNAFIAVIKSSRPAGWCFGPILYSIGLLNSRTRPRTPLALALSAFQVFSLSLPLCTIVFGINDVYDYKTDIVNPRKVSDGLEGTVLLPRYHDQVRRFAYLSSGLIFTTALLSRRTKVLFATAFLVLLGWQYSAPPLRLKEVALVDSLSNGVVVFLAWFIGFHSNGNPRGSALKGYLLGICTAGVHALGAVVDVTFDIAAGQQTIATTFGLRWSTAFSVSTYLLALYMEGLMSIFGVYLAGGVLSTLMALVYPEWAHLAFRTIIYWTLCMSTIWSVTKMAEN